MAKNISPEKLKNLEEQAIALMEKIWIQVHDKKTIARIITFIVLAIAVIQELFLESHLSNNWYEITVYLLMGYFGIATYRSIFRLK